MVSHTKHLGGSCSSTLMKSGCSTVWQVSLPSARLCTCEVRRGVVSRASILLSLHSPRLVFQFPAAVEVLQSSAHSHHASLAHSPQRLIPRPLTTPDHHPRTSPGAEHGERHTSTLLLRKSPPSPVTTSSPTYSTGPSNAPTPPSPPL